MEQVYFSEPSVRALLDRESSAVSTSKDFTKWNLYGVHVMLELWASQLDEVDSRNVITLRDTLLPRLGLFKTIKLCNECALHILSIGDSDERSADGQFVLDEVILSLTHSNDVRTTLQLLRFPKRLSLFKADKLEEASVEAFLDLQREAKIRNRYFGTLFTVTRERCTGNPPVVRESVVRHTAVLQLLAQELNGIFSKYRPVTWDDIWKEGDLSSGYAQTNKSKVAWQKIDSFPVVNYGDVSYPRRLTKWGQEVDGTVCLPSEQPYPLYWEDARKRADCYCCEVMPVPKDYSKARIVAAEDAFRNFAHTVVRKHLVKALEKGLTKRYALPYDPDNQENNRVAMVINWELVATIDLSNASDSICVAAAYLYPKAVVNDVRQWRAEACKRNGKVLTPNHIWLTSGCTVTFAFMSGLLLAVCQLVGRWANLKDLVPALVYGDDMIVDRRIYDAVVEVLTILGFAVNPSKSYAGGPFRESCGVDTWNGEVVTTNYWPRRPLLSPRPDDCTTYAALIDLQHKFYDNLPVRAIITRYALECLRTMRHRVTYTTPLSTINCLWHDIATPYTLPSDDANSWRPLRYVVVGSKTGKLPSDLHSNPRYENYLMWKYVEYLREGPRLAEDPLMRLLGLTESRIQPGDFGGGSPCIEYLIDEYVQV